ncbi:MAG TPA: VOC family protein [Actinomycetota bacterium]|nr:VOC family protein [Actinomycetota bacterium]
MGNAVVHFNISGPEPYELERFYTSLFGWALDDTGMDYALVDTQAGHGINGGIGPSGDAPAGVTIYVAVDDLVATMGTAVGLGASVVLEPFELPGVVSLAMFVDPWGHPIGLVGPRPDGSKAPEPSPGEGLGVSWFEIMGPDTDAQAAFYRDLFGWEIERFPGAPIDYREVHTNAGGINGGMGTPPAGPAYQTVYVSSPDVGATLARAEELGAKTLMGPETMPGGPEVAMFQDPHGNVFGLFRANPG